MGRNTRLIALLLSSCCLYSCSKKEEKPWRYETPPTSASGMPTATTPDRLPPGKLMEGPEDAFGFPIPKGMTLSRPNRKAVRAVGRVDFNDLTDYVKDRISVRHAEMFGSRLVFPNAKLRSGGDTILEFALTEYRGQSILMVHNRTPLPPTHGLTEKERWERAGFTFEGGRIDPKVLE